MTRTRCDRLRELYRLMDPKETGFLRVSVFRAMGSTVSEQCGEVWGSAQHEGLSDRLQLESELSDTSDKGGEAAVSEAGFVTNTDKVFPEGAVGFAAVMAAYFDAATIEH